MFLQLLICTMNQKDFLKVKQMNLETDTIIANQSNEYRYEETFIDERRIQMITTNTRGTSVNRNIAIANAAKGAECIMFSDDDLIFVDGYENIVKREFETHPKSEAICK